MTIRSSLLNECQQRSKKVNYRGELNQRTHIHAYAAGLYETNVVHSD